MGLPLGVAAYFWANRLLPIALEARAEWEMHILFLAWALSFVHAGARELKRAWSERELANWYLIGYHCSMTTLANPQAAAALLRSARITAGLSLRVLAARAGTSHATLSAYERGRKVPSISTYVRVLEACGNAVDLQLQPRIRECDGIARGEELASVLALAAQFPAKVSRHLELPVFSHG